MWTTGSKKNNPVIGVSAGEPAGIGPDLCLKIAAQPHSVRLVVAADKNLLKERADQLGCPFAFDDFDIRQPHNVQPGKASIWHHPLAQPVRAGHLDPANSPYVLTCLDNLTDACQSGVLQALVTAPVQKSIIEKAGIPFTGHTEYLAHRLGVPKVVMMLVGRDLRVALATTHLPLREVPEAITLESLGATLHILNDGLRQYFQCPHPRILVTGLNPHAGESGHLGREEIDVIFPALAAARRQGIDARGPYPADTLFIPKHLETADCVLAMYHDQGLPALKMNSFGGGVNVTLGLPIIRTSVDHGTALDLAGTGRLDSGSMEAALELAQRMACSFTHAAQTT